MTKGLTRTQREAVALLSIGTFLEYFDLMLYIHMAVLLNGLFFPQTNPLTAQLLAAFTFCSTALMRPLGGLLIGWIGDCIGRKSTIILTTAIMAISCIVMANIGTYAEIGITASIAIIVCRALQGMSSMGEAIGASLYYVETLKQPHRYIAGGITEFAAKGGGLVALMVASFALSMSLNWRIAFWIGATIAIVGIFARTRLRETPEFVDFKRRMKRKMELNKQNPEVIKDSPVYKEKLDKKAVVAYFLIRLVFPSCFYIAYIYLGDFMKVSLGMTPEQVIHQNLKITILSEIVVLVFIFLLRKQHPLKILQPCVIAFTFFLPFIPHLLGNLSSLFLLSCVQMIILSIALGAFSVEMVCFKYIAIVRRFTILATTFGVAAALSTTIISFSLIPLNKYLGHYGLWVIYVPLLVGFLWSLQYIKKLEKQNNRYDTYPKDESQNPDTASQELDDYGFEDKESYQAYTVDCEYARELLQNAQGKIDIKLIEKAIIFAKKWHDGQFRETGEPFYSHPLKVASIIMKEYIVKTDIIVAAILHDVVEDSGCTVDLIIKEFNPHVARMVDHLTKIRFESGKKIKLSLPEMIARMHKANDNEALFIKQIDRLHNISTIQIKSKEKQMETAVETNNCLMILTDYIADKLNIGSSVCLENKLFKCCRDILVSK